MDTWQMASDSELEHLFGVDTNNLKPPPDYVKPKGGAHGFICTLCGDVCDGQATIRKHTPDESMGRFTYSVAVCYQCEDVPLCPATTTGQHGEVVDYDFILDAAIVHQVPNWLRFLEETPERLGMCSGCQHWMVWSVVEQRWIEPEDHE